MRLRPLHYTLVKYQACMITLWQLWTKYTVADVYKIQQQADSWMSALQIMQMISCLVGGYDCWHCSVYVYVWIDTR